MAQRLPIISAREAVRALERAGFFIHHATGSHAQLKHRTDPALRVTVPIHAADLPRGTLCSIIRQAGLSVEAFLKFLRAWRPDPVPGPWLPWMAEHARQRPTTQAVAPRELL